MMISFPSIDNFSKLYNTIEYRFRYRKNEEGIAIYDETIPLPTIDFFGTVKAHGTNSSIVLYKNQESLVAQSRNRVLNLQHDNLGFCAYVLQNESPYKKILTLIADYFSANTVALFGEWSGKGIQKGVAISELPRMFLIFAAKIDDNWLTAKQVAVLLDDISNEIDYSINQILDSVRCFPIADFGIYRITIDFNSPHSAQEQIDSWVSEIYKLCPIGKAFGVISHGEGLVFTGKLDDITVMFKAKGTSFTNVKSKADNPTKIDNETYENIRNFVNDVVTESRLEQGINYLQEMELPIIMQNMGTFLSWINQDVLKEEGRSIVENGFEVKVVNKEISNVAREWYKNRVNQL